MDGLLRHLRACNNTELPGGRVPLRLRAQRIGWLSPEVARLLAGLGGEAGPEGITFQDAAALGPASVALAAAGHGRIRGEAFDIRATPEGPVLGVLDRGAVPVFGVLAQGVHLNGLVRRPDGLHVWLGLRAADKAVAPGMLDNLVAGGLSAGLTPEACLIKEAGEEAAIPPELAAQSRRASRLGYVMAAPEGLRRDVLHVFDLDLPEGFMPVPDGDEVERFDLWPAREVLDVLRREDSVKFNVALVLIDLFLREGLVGDPDGRLRGGLDRFA
ncbi:NUDIX domain-containing protein [Humitalea rosea]|uniref:NUDIX domain-containing protein n=1 Tax=Humitalea rosea TaxID=990373 RepID=A0A2W7JDT5_9PROT|nr:NUDIX domain-containing protein [Humitalea rosea]PZW50352.1 NUDIX domain-containing protein [Humitalea rosea]